MKLKRILLSSYKLEYVFWFVALIVNDEMKEQIVKAQNMKKVFLMSYMKFEYCGKQKFYSENTKLIDWWFSSVNHWIFLGWRPDSLCKLLQDHPTSVIQSSSTFIISVIQFYFIRTNLQNQLSIHSKSSKSIWIILGLFEGELKNL